jgi:hypothetical protein
MKEISYKGIIKVIDLLNKELDITNIVDSYGRPIHNDAKEFFSYHKQAKRLLLKKLSYNINFRNFIYNKYNMN